MPDAPHVPKFHHFTARQKVGGIRSQKWCVVGWRDADEKDGRAVAVVAMPHAEGMAKMIANALNSQPDLLEASEVAAIYLGLQPAGGPAQKQYDQLMSAIGKAKPRFSLDAPKVEPNLVWSDRTKG